MRNLLFGALSALGPLGLTPGPPTGAVGRIRSAEEGTPLAGVAVSTSATGARVASDETGWYRISLTPGLHWLTFEAMGRRGVRLAAIVPDSGFVRIDLDLVTLPLQLEPIVVQVERVDPIRGAEREARPPTQPWSRLRVPAHDDPFEWTAGQPGVTVRGDGGGTLHLEGGDADQHVVRLDGFPVFGATHFGAAASGINPDIVGQIDLQSAAGSNPEAGWLSGAIDLESTLLTPQSDGVRGAVTPTDLRQSVQHRLFGDQGRLLVSIRRSYRNVLGDPTADESANGYGDWLGEVGARAGPGWLRLMAYLSRNQLAFPSEVEASGEQVDGSAPPGPPGPANQLEWGGGTGGLSWRGDWARSRVDVTIWRAASASIVDWMTPGAPLHLDSRFAEHGIRVNAGLGASEAWHLGAAWIANDARLAAGPGTPAPSVETTSHTARLSAFGERTWAVGQLVLVRAGTGLTILSDGWVGFEPRLAMSYHPLAAVDLTLTASRNHQFAQSLRNQESFLGTLVGFEIPATVGTPGVPIASASNLELGVGVRASPSLSLGLQLYARRFDGLLLVAPGTGQPVANALAGVGRGSARGLEIRAQYTSNRLVAALSYGAGAAQRQLGSLVYQPGFQRRQTFALRAVATLGRATTAGLSLRASDGQHTSLIGPLEWQPYDPLSGSGELLGTPNNLDRLPGTRVLPGSVRLDLGIRHDWRLPTTAGGGRLATSFGIDNLFDRSNPVALVGGPGGGQIEPISTVRRSLRIELAWRVGS